MSVSGRGSGGYSAVSLSVIRRGRGRLECGVYVCEWTWKGWLQCGVYVCE